MEVRKIVIYVTSNGKEPFTEWSEKLDKKTRAIVMNRLDRVRLGNFGDSKSLQGTGGLYELRIDFGPGYRIYFAKESNTIIIVLAGGCKKSQSRDTATAEYYWLDYKESS